jgi:hypothetical protein
MKTFKLEDEPKIKSGFKTPENYFDNVSAKIMQQIEGSETKVIPLYRRKAVILIAAAAAIIVALMIPIFNSPNNSFIELDDNTMETYLSYQTNIIQYDLFNELDNADLKKMNDPIALEEEMLEDILSSNPYIENLVSE